MILKKLSKLWQKIISVNKRRLAVGLVVVLTVVLAVLTLWGLFDFQHAHIIKVYGESPYTDEEIIAASEIERGQLLFSIDPAKAEENILKGKNAKPYIREVRVTRWFFSFVSIKVVADTPKYYIQISKSTEEYYLLSEDLRVLDCLYSKEGLEEKGLVYLELPELKTCNMGQVVEYGEEGKNDFVRETIDYLELQEYGEMITAIGLPSRFEGAYITFYGRCRILLGKPEKPDGLELKIERARKHIDSIVGNGGIDVGYIEVDVSREGETLVSYPENLE